MVREVWKLIKSILMCISVYRTSVVYYCVVLLCCIIVSGALSRKSFWNDQVLFFLRCLGIGKDLIRWRKSIERRQRRKHWNRESKMKK